jgi:protein required for attachment to host cells
MKLTHGSLVLVADGGKMLLFRNEGDEKFLVLETIDHLELENVQNREQGSDRPGRTHSSVDDRRSSYSEVDWHRQAEIRLAKEAARRLRAAASENGRDVLLIASPRFLGELRGRLDAALLDRLVGQIPADLVHRTTDDIVRVISQH